MTLHTDNRDRDDAMEKGTERIPVDVFPLASFIADELQARGWQTEDVAARMDSERGFVRDLLCLDLIMCVHQDNLLIDNETFGGLAHVFGVSEDFFRNLDRVWRENPDRRTPYQPPESLFGPISRGTIWEPS